MRLKKVVQTFRKYSLELKSKLKEKANAATKSLDQNNRNACDLQPKKTPETLRIRKSPIHKREN